MTTIYDLSFDPKSKIRELFEEILDVYNNHMRQKVDGACDICGKGDTNKHFRLKSVISGFENRPDQSPMLCYNHFCGWNLSYVSKEKDIKFERCPQDELHKLARFEYEDEMKAKYGMTEEEVNLHFATYLTKQLMKEAKLHKQMEKL